jgi:hypothetical protein
LRCWITLASRGAGGWLNTAPVSLIVITASSASPSKNGLPMSFIARRPRDQPVRDLGVVDEKQGPAERRDRRRGDRHGRQDDPPEMVHARIPRKPRAHPRCCSKR